MSGPALLRGAVVVDGTGGPQQVQDVLVSDGHVVASGKAAADHPDAGNAQSWDLDGLVLAPGFIDIHTHSDISVLQSTAAESKVLQGVTTEVVGNCSFSAFPNGAERLDLHRDHMARIGEPPLDVDWTDLEGYADRLEAAPPALNVAALVGHGTLRVATMGVEQRPPTADEQAAMRELLRSALRAGAFGLSTGLTHVPSSYGDADEVIDLLGPVASAGALYATHARAVAGAELDAVREALMVSAASGARLQYSHVALNDPVNWGRASEYLGLFDDAVECGHHVGFDLYPYAASSSSLTQYLPGWVQVGGSAALSERLTDPDTYRRAREETARGWYGGIPWLWDRVTIAHAPEPGLAGRTMAQLALERAVDPVDLTLELCRRHGNQVEVVMAYRTEEDMQTFLAHPLSTIGSDGNAIDIHQRERRPHPRHYGTFPRVLGRYVRELGVLELSDAVRKMSAANADRLGLRDRGRIAPGQVADLVAFDPATVADRATFEDPCQAPTGIEHVWVGGTLVVQGGVQRDARPGRLLRSGRSSSITASGGQATTSSTAPVIRTSSS
ncbi:N-acyl-D-amino-acid deacylase family protein [Pseudactinotalea suaedae]|uniref:N-acyl-D-amino-acid deacylase family protein n=1 Tax=Pseudactinotalea suaedae TaxID=1524924 RepID=UPI0012E28667|nr:D-aminoacylase [Pseudactinotalea suaedae]